MKKYKLEVLLPWDDAWYPMSHVGPFWTRAGAVGEMAKQSLLFPSDHKFRITKNGVVIYQES